MADPRPIKNITSPMSMVAGTRLTVSEDKMNTVAIKLVH